MYLPSLEGLSIESIMDGLTSCISQIFECNKLTIQKLHIL
jgi:hypothetical protein